MSYSSSMGKADWIFGIKHLSKDKSLSLARAFSMELIMDTVGIMEKVATEKVLTTERVAIMEEELTTGKVATTTAAILGHLAHHWAVPGNVLDLFG